MSMERIFTLHAFTFICVCGLLFFTKGSDAQTNQGGVEFRLSYFCDENFTSSLTESQRTVICSRILPAARAWLLSTITKVFRKGDFDPIRLQRPCDDGSVRDGSGDLFCKEKCRALVYCGNYVVPDDHLVCRKCVTNQKCPQCIDCKPDSTPGVPDSDYLLYMTAKDNPNCQVSGTVFTSTSCNSTVEEGRGKLDRPIAGSINICPNALSDSPSDFEYQMNLFLRELISLLGFRTEFYAYFRDSNGNPRTARDSYGKPQKDASTSTVLVSKTPWITAGQLQNVQRSQENHVVVTPAVRKQAQDHFNCDNLIGVPLEGNSLSFWDKRVLMGDLMTSDVQPGSVVSSITLALLEDTGWYQVNYSQAGYLPWGNNFGCTFANGSCLAYALENAHAVSREQSTIDRSWKPLFNIHQLQWGSKSEFSQAVTNDQQASDTSNTFPFSSVLNTTMAYTQCTYNHRFVGQSNLNLHTSDLQSKYLYFTGLYSAHGSGSTSDWKQYGGTDKNTNYCPYYEPMALSSSTTKLRYYYDCKDPSLTPEKNNFLERYGFSSVCVNFASPWTHGNDSVTMGNHISSGCYEISCHVLDQSLSIAVAGTAYNCPHSGAVVNVSALVDSTWIRGQIICPSYDIVCSYRAGCPGDCHSRGMCQSTDKGTKECVCYAGFTGIDCSHIVNYGRHVPIGPTPSSQVSILTQEVPISGSIQNGTSLATPFTGNSSDISKTPPPHAKSDDKGEFEYTTRVIANYVACFTAALVVILILIWLFKCGGMQHGKMKGPPSRAQQRQQRQAAQSLRTSSTIVREPSEVQPSLYPPAYRVRPQGSSIPLYSVQGSAGPYAFTSILHEEDLTEHRLESMA